MVTSQTTMATETYNSSEYHALANKWTMWAHLPHDTDWSINSYKKIYTMETVEQAIALTETLPDVLVKNCMLFLMQSGRTHKIVQVVVFPIRFQINPYMKFGKSLVMYWLEKVLVSNHPLLPM